MIDWIIGAIGKLLALCVALAILMPPLIWADRRQKQVRERLGSLGYGGDTMTAPSTCPSASPHC